MGEVENKLLQLTSSGSSSKSVVEVGAELPAEVNIRLDEIEDLTNRSSKILSNLDYQILVAMTGIVGEDKVAEEFGVTKGYIRKLMRSADGSEFLKEQAKQKAEMSLAISTNMLHEGLNLWQNHIGELLQKGQTEMALFHLFGKSSLSEVQSNLHKQQSSVPEDNGNSLLNLFASISVGVANEVR